MSLVAAAVTTVNSLRRRRVGRTVFIVVVVLFALLNIYRSTTLIQSPASSHEFSHRHQLRHSPPSDHFSVTGRSTPSAEVDRLLLIRSVRENDYPEYNVTMDTGEVRVVPLWQRRLSQRHTNSSANANAALEDDSEPYYFLTELLQVSVSIALCLADRTAVRSIISYWHDTVVCLSLCPCVCDKV